MVAIVTIKGSHQSFLGTHIQSEIGESPHSVGPLPAQLSLTGESQQHQKAWKEEEPSLISLLS